MIESCTRYMPHYDDVLHRPSTVYTVPKCRFRVRRCEELLPLRGRRVWLATVDHLIAQARQLVRYKSAMAQPVTRLIREPAVP